MKTLYRAARVHTLTHPPTGEWVLVDDRHVSRVGSGDPPEADRRMELPGATILPGFVDAHVHLAATGMQLADEDVREARSADELLAVARVRAKAGEGALVLGGYDESTWANPRPPGIADLDEVTERPLVIRRVDGHAALANTRAIRDAEVRGSDGCEIGDEGRPTGRLVGRASRAMWRWATSMLTELEMQDLQLRGAALAASRGVTAVHEMSMPEWWGGPDLETLLAHRSRLPVDVLPMVAATDPGRAVALHLPAVGGDLPVDGSIGARTAAVSVPYADAEGSGRLTLEGDDLAEFLHDGHMAGLQVGVHAIGDRAIEEVIATWERVYGSLDSRERRHFRARRHRIEHVEMATPGHIERAAMLGLAFCIQPAFDRTWGAPGGLYEHALGPKRAASMNAFRTMLERGLELGVGSDAPIVALDPWEGVASLETHHDPAQRLGRAEAIRAHTVGSARLGHQEDKKGMLAPGMHADLAAYDVDPFDVAEVDGLRPVLTVSNGREVFMA